MTLDEFAASTTWNPAPARYGRTWEIRLLERRRITESGCWEWTGARRSGYGRVMIERRHYTVHRLAAAVWLGLNYDDRRLLACHSCDNPPCFNPEHLFIGTAEDNMRDMVAKGRRGTPQRQRPTLHPRSRACDICGKQYEPHVDHRARSRVCSPACHNELRGAQRRGKGFVLTPESVLEIKRELAAGEKGVDIARRFGVSTATVSNIRTGKRWGHL